MKTATVKLPAFLASALVNGDTSGLTCTCNSEETCSQRMKVHVKDCDFKALADAHAYVAPGRIVGTTNDGARFSKFNDLPGKAGHTGGDVCDYVVLYPNDEEG